ncbi:MAG: hypothetical protein ACRD4U_01005 [Candidatus Acidiferrales bacterium]
MRTGIGILTVGLFVCSVLASQPAKPAKLEKVAEGEFVNRLGGGEYEIRERWTLWRNLDGHYVVTGDVRTSPVGPAPARTLQYELRLSDALKPLDIRLSYREVKGASILFEFGDTELRYRAERKDLVQPEEMTVPLAAPYTLFPGISWWQMGLLCREAKAPVGQPVSVRFVFMDDDPKQPIGVHPFEGSVEYVGEEEVDVGGRRLKASRFEVNPGWPVRANDPGHGMTLWVLPEGLPTAATSKDAGQVNVQLVRYKKYAEFGPAK